MKRKGRGEKREWRGKRVWRGGEGSTGEGREGTERGEGGEERELVTHLLPSWSLVSLWRFKPWLSAAD